MSQRGDFFKHIEDKWRKLHEEKLKAYEAKLEQMKMFEELYLPINTELQDEIYRTKYDYVVTHLSKARRFLESEICLEMDKLLNSKDLQFDHEFEFFIHFDPEEGFRTTDYKICENFYEKQILEKCERKSHVEELFEKYKKGKIKKNPCKLIVKFPNGEVLDGPTETKVFSMAIRQAGWMNVYDLNIKTSGKPLLFGHYNINDEIEDIGRKRYLYTGYSNSIKAKILKKISDSLNLNWEVILNK